MHNAQCKHKDKQYNHLCSSCAYAYVKLESAAVSIGRNISPPSCISISRRCGLENRQLSILYICVCSVMLVLWVSSLPACCRSKNQVLVLMHDARNCTGVKVQECSVFSGAQEASGNSY